jgi:Zn-dependent M28 family amino/carboxypeptidase
MTATNFRPLHLLFVPVLAIICCLNSASANDGDVDRLVAAMLGETPLIDDLYELTDTIGGRVTGSLANQESVAWAAGKFRAAKVAVQTEDFEMPHQWREHAAEAHVSGAVDFTAGVVAKPFSTAVNALQAPLVDGGIGSEGDFARLGDAAKGAWVLIETPVLDDEAGLAGLFAEYNDAAVIEPRAFNADVAGIVFMSSRPRNLVFRHNAALGRKNQHPLLVMEREHAKRALRILRAGNSLSLTATIDVDDGGAYTSTNVIGEIRGGTRPEEIVIFGAHLDAHDLGTGALDNGINVVMLINIARQIVRLGLKPERTIRFALWNGEEQGLVGSWKYTQRHEPELDRHVVAASFDIGSGRTTGFFTGGRPDLVSQVDEYLLPVSGLGPFQHADVPIVGTDNFDFMIEGVPNIVAIQADANYASNYHAESDTFDKVDQHQVRLNSAVVAALVWGFANSADRLPRQSHEEIEALINGTDLEQQMRNFAVWDDWAEGVRGRHD